MEIAACLLIFLFPTHSQLTSWIVYNYLAASSEQNDPFWLYIRPAIIVFSYLLHINLRIYNSKCRNCI